MISQGLQQALSAYGVAAPVKPAYGGRKLDGVAGGGASAGQANFADKVSLSAAAQAKLAAEMAAQASPAAGADAAIAAQLEAIKAKPAVERSEADTQFLQANDKRLAEIIAKGDKNLTADELDYMQKAGGFVNTMAELSPGEKALYDELVARGEHDAAAGLGLIAMARTGMGGQKVVLPDGRSFDPRNTEVTADNVRQLFRQMFVDGSGQTDRQFEALAQYMDRKTATAEKPAHSAETRAIA